MKRFGRAIGGAALVSFGAAFGFTYYYFRKMMGHADYEIPERDSPKLQKNLKPYTDKIFDGIEFLHSDRCETVYTDSHDGLKLAALCVPAESARATIILMHGFRSSPYWDFSGIVRKYSDMGLNLLIPFQRAHGKSEGKYLTFGVKERYDVHSWINWIKERFGQDEKIILDGLSMGCATVLMGSELGYPENVKGIIADCGYTTPYEIVSSVMTNNMHLPKYPFIWLYDLSCRLFADFSLKACSATEAMKRNSVPVLFAHGEADDFVPYSMSKANYDACTAEKVFYSVPGAGHAMCYLIGQNGYDEEIDKFIEKIL